MTHMSPIGTYFFSNTASAVPLQGLTRYHPPSRDNSEQPNGHKTVSNGVSLMLCDSNDRCVLHTNPHKNTHTE